MSKNYEILNSNTNSSNPEECTIFYLLYIVLFFVIIFIIYKIMFCFNSSRDKFENVSAIANTSTPNQETLQYLTDKNNELNTIKDTLKSKLLEQSQAIYLSNNFNKVDESSYNDELTFILAVFADTKFPELDMTNKKIINNESELNTALEQAKNMKNFYKPGEVVNSNSTFGITKDDICYRENNKPIKPTPEFMMKYPNCMVCSVENNDDLTNTLGWKNTKTNISKVCLYDPNANNNSGIPNLNQCKTFCNIK
jgi:cell division protein FtsB